ncbi:MAG: hypothetical protein PHO65_01460 [Sulfurovum sp.]|nr:hypothetical protein [Sulfurovum sp.]
MQHFFLKLLVPALLIQTLYAAEKYDSKTFRVITKECGMCHGTPFYFAKQKDEDTWMEYFEEDQTLVQVHQKDPKALKSVQGKRFRYYRKDILKFFINNSKYSGVVHGCDANFCGTHH